LDHRPLRLPTRAEFAEPIVPWKDEGHPVLLVVHEAALASGARGERGAPDLQWLNLLDQGFGGCDLLSTDSLAREPERVLRGRELVILPRRSLASLDPALNSTLERLTEEHGLVLFFECPEDPWTEAAGIQLATVERRRFLPWPVPESWADPSRLPTGAAPQPLLLPHVLWRYGPVLRGRRMAAPILSIAGRPMIWSRSLGPGAWLSSSVDLGALAQALRPGRVGDSAEGEPLSVGGASSPAAAAHPSPGMMDRMHSWLDAWLSALLGPEIAPAPWPRWWCAPPGSAGWLVLTIDDEKLHARLTPNNGDALDLGDVDATIFVPASAAGSGRTSVPTGRVGLLARWPGSQTWHDPDAPRQMRGWMGIEPVGRLPSLSEQSLRLKAWLGSGALEPVARLHGLVWPSEPDRVWQALVASGARVDCSLGPLRGPGKRPLGSAMPFRPLARGGRVWSIWELPHRLTVETPDELDPLDGWMRANAVAMQGPMHVRLTGPAVADAEGRRALFESLLGLARQHRHQPIDPLELCAWWERRAASRLRWTLQAEQLRIEIDCAASADGDLAVAVPLSWDGRRLGSWKASWPSTRSTVERSFDRRVRVFSVPPGHHELTLRYPRP
jgi:hypothetical protein